MIGTSTTRLLLATATAMALGVGEPPKELASLEAWFARFDEADYRVDRDADRKIVYVTALDPTSHDRMRAMIERQVDHLSSTLFDPQADQPALLVAVPTPRDADAFFGARQEVGGIYQPPSRRLVARNIGYSLRHELVHAVHHGHMKALGQAHPLWIQEGLSALYEHHDLDEEGVRFLPNQRDNIVHRAARSRSLVPWRTLATMSEDRFMTRRRQLLHYAQVRSMFTWLADLDELERWYEHYTRDFEDDPTGLLAFEEVLGAPVEDLERRWRRWILGRGTVDDTVRPGDASLGVLVGARLTNDGVKITDMIEGSAATEAGLRVDDVIVGIDEEEIRSMDDLMLFMGRCRTGQVVSVRLRRDVVYLAIDVTLRSHGRPERRR